MISTRQTKCRNAKAMPIGLVVLLFVLAAFPALVFGDDPIAAEDFTQQDPPLQSTLEDPVANDDAPYWNKTVRKISFNLPPWMSTKQIQRVTKIKAGKPLTQWRVRMTIRRVYLLGKIENVLVKATTLPDGRVDIEIKIYPTYVIRDIIIKDNVTFNYVEVVEEILGITSGDDFFDNDVDLWEQKIEKALAKEGKLNANVRFRYEKTKRHIDNKVDIFINIDEHKTFRVRNLEITGDLGPYPAKLLLKKMKLRKGMAVKEVDFVKGVTRLEKFLKKNEHLEMKVPDWDINDKKMAKIDKDDSRVDVTFKIRVGPKVRIDFNKDCFSCAQQKWKMGSTINLANQRQFNKYIVKDWENKIEAFFQARGYYDTVVIGTYEETEQDGYPVKNISFIMERGEKISIRRIDFKNNPSFNDSKLIRLLTSSKHFTQKGFDTDLENIVNFYNRNGFLGAKVIEKRLKYVQDDGLYIQVVLDEGPRTILKAVNIPDTKVFDREHFATLFNKMSKNEKLLIDKPLNPFVVDSAKALIIAEYLRKGYIKSRIKSKVKISKDGKEAVVTFEVKEGRRYKFGNIYILGNKLTKNYVIRRELFITTGHPFNYEQVFDSEQALVALGFFRSVQIRPIDADIKEEQVDLLVELEERSSGYVETGLGYNTYFGYSAGFEVGHKNLAGHGRRLSFHADGAMRDEHFRFDNRHINLTFIWPWMGRVPLDGTFTIFDNLDRAIGYNVNSFGTILGVSTVVTKMLYHLKATRTKQNLQRFSKFCTLGLEYEFAKDFIFNLDDDIEEDAGEIQVAILRPSFIRDERNNPFNPTSGIKSPVGSVYSVTMNWSLPALQSQVFYVQTIAQASWYVGLFDVSALGKFVFAQNLRSGHGQVLRETDQIPLSRRFTLGGSTTVRGFSEGEISPLADDSDTPIGGNFFLQSNTEFRIPLPKSLGLLLFFDAGDVTKDLEHFYIDLMRTSAGLGLRYMTPIGPISADYGFKLNRRKDETVGEFYIMIGNAF